MLLASVLAIGASSFAGCGDTDCPSSLPATSSCSSAGLSCSADGYQCTCDGAHWSCLTVDDMHYVPPPDLARADLAMPDEGAPRD